MIQFETTNGKYLAVEVPEESTGHRIVTYQGDKVILHSMNLNAGVGPDGMIPVPSKSVLVGRADALTDEQWAVIVDYLPQYNQYHCYTSGLMVASATTSGISLMRSLSIPLNSLILKIEP